MFLSIFSKILSILKSSQKKQFNDIKSYLLRVFSFDIVKRSSEIGIYFLKLYHHLGFNKITYTKNCTSSDIH